MERKECAEIQPVPVVNNDPNGKSRFDGLGPMRNENHELLELARRQDTAAATALRHGGASLEAMALAHSPDCGFSAEEKRCLRALYSSYETLLENDFARSFQDAKTPPDVESYPLWQRFQRLTRAEIAGTRLADGEEIAFIGSGPFPVSAISYARQRRARVCCIDSNPGAIETARMVIESLGLSTRICFECIHGQDADFSRYDVIAIAVLAQPKPEILGQICRTARAGSRVACRTVYGKCDMIYEDFRGPFPPRMIECAVHCAGREDTISCRFFKC